MRFSTSVSLLAAVVVGTTSVLANEFNDVLERDVDLDVEARQEATDDYVRELPSYELEARHHHHGDAATTPDTGDFTDELDAREIDEVEARVAEYQGHRGMNGGNGWRNGRNGWRNGRNGWRNYRNGRGGRRRHRKHQQPARVIVKYVQVPAKGAPKPNGSSKGGPGGASKPQSQSRVVSPKGGAPGQGSRQGGSKPPCSHKPPCPQKPCPHGKQVGAPKGGAPGQGARQGAAKKPCPCPHKPCPHGKQGARQGGSKPPCPPGKQGQLRVAGAPGQGARRGGKPPCHHNPCRHPCSHGKKAQPGGAPSRGARQGQPGGPKPPCAPEKKGQQSGAPGQGARQGGSQPSEKKSTSGQSLDKQPQEVCQPAAPNAQKKQVQPGTPYADLYKLRQSNTPAPPKLIGPANPAGSFAPGAAGPVNQHVPAAPSVSSWYKPKAREFYDELETRHHRKGGKGTVAGAADSLDLDDF